MENESRIQNLSLVMQWLCYLFLVCATVVVGIMLYHMFFQPELLEMYTNRNMVSMLEIARQVGPVRGFIATILLFLPAPILMYALWQLSKLLGQFRRKQYFTVATSGYFYSFAWSWILFHLLPLPMVFVADAILTLGTGLDTRGVSIFLNGDELPSFVASVTLLIIAWVLRESVRIAEENAEFV